MLSAIRDFFRSALATDQGGEPDRRHRLQLATAALMLEMSRVDGAVTADEEATLRAALSSQFGLADAELDTLLELAGREARESAGDYAFTSLINAGFSAAEKVRIIEYMWKIAYVDGRIDAHENHYLRKLADLLHISLGDYAAAKRRAREAGD